MHISNTKWKLNCTMDYLAKACLVFFIKYVSLIMLFYFSNDAHNLIVKECYLFVLSCLNLPNHGVFTYALGIVEKPWMERGALKWFCNFWIYYIGDWILNRFLIEILINWLKFSKTWSNEIMSIIFWRALTYLYLYTSDYGQHYILCKVNIYFSLPC